MGKIILLSAFLTLSAVFFGTALAPETSVFYLLSTNTSTQIVRAVLLLVMFEQLRSNPPRNVYFRAVSGFVGLFGITWALQQTYAFRIMPTDTLALLAAAIAITFTTLELRELPAPVKKLNYVKVKKPKPKLAKRTA